MLHIDYSIKHCVDNEFTNLLLNKILENNKDN